MIYYFLIDQFILSKVEGNECEYMGTLIFKWYMYDTSKNIVIHADMSQDLLSTDTPQISCVMCRTPTLMITLNYIIFFKLLLMLMC
jgi:hypothetical protein